MRLIAVSTALILVREHSRINGVAESKSAGEQDEVKYLRGVKQGGGGS